VAQKSSVDGTAMILKGGNFTAKFQVQSPAQQPTPSGSPVPDGSTEYSGSGSFVTTNTKLKAT
jgi:hypothetical protein